VRDNGIVCVDATLGLTHSELLRLIPAPKFTNLHHAPGIILPFETDEEIVGIADQVRLAPEPWPDLLLEPQVEHFV
jgi:hypothetical protein